MPLKSTLSLGFSGIPERKKVSVVASTNVKGKGGRTTGSKFLVVISSTFLFL